ncbi:MAG TPA: hypothetical protein VF824_18300 [Thermoanaerobaculia bacterium]
MSDEPGQTTASPDSARVFDPKILERLLEWARTADDKVARYTLIAVGLALFWFYYAVLVPISASSRKAALSTDLGVLELVAARFTDIHLRLREVSRPTSIRRSTSQQTPPFFRDVFFPRLLMDQRIQLTSNARAEAVSLNAQLVRLAAIVERCRSFYEEHARAAPALNTSGWPNDGKDPSIVLENLEEVESVMLRLQRLNMTSSNTEWLDQVEHTLALDNEPVRLGTTVTGSFSLYEPLVGTWAPGDRSDATDVYKIIAARHAEARPHTLQQLNSLRERLAVAASAADAELRVRQLRVPFTSVDVDREVLLAAGPLVLILLQHFMITYLLLTRKIDETIFALWGTLAAHTVATLRPADAVFHRAGKFGKKSLAAQAATEMLHSGIHVLLPAAPAALAAIAFVASLTSDAVNLHPVTTIATFACAIHGALVVYWMNRLTTHTGTNEQEEP